MSREEITLELSKQKTILEEMGYKVAYIALYGSQNYKLDLHTDDYQSDIDTKAVIVPSLDDLVNNSKPVSIKVMSETGEIDVKDIRVYMENLLKANPAYLETIFTDYYIIDVDFKDEFEEIMSRREELVSTLKMQMLKAMYGMMLEKQKALCHPYPSTAWKIEKWGFDGKQLSHMYRLLRIMFDYFGDGKTFKESLVPNNEFRETILEYKLNQVSLEDALEFSGYYHSLAKSFRDTTVDEVDETKIDYTIKDDFMRLSKKMIKDKIVNDVIEDYDNYLEHYYSDKGDE